MISEVIHADCFDVLYNWEHAQVDLVYLDPPFKTGNVQRSGEISFQDNTPAGTYYDCFMKPRLSQIHKVLKPAGAVLLHCDWRTSHRLRVILDEIFGEANFINHLIWSYGLGGSSPRRFARKHDDILFYAKGPAYHFEPPMVHATSQRMKGKLKKATDIIEMDDILRIPSLNNMAKERVGYPTQKPIELLTFLINACCMPGERALVVDPFCGSGTTLVAAKQTGRSCIGIDISEAAVEISRNRLGVGTVV